MAHVQETVLSIHGVAEKYTKQNVNLSKESFKYIAPYWPLENLIATNPLQGLEDMPFEEALAHGATYFENNIISQQLEAINRATIKWLQAFFDHGQATIKMPLREYGLYRSWRKLAIYDTHLHNKQAEKLFFLQELPESSYKTITRCLKFLNIKQEDHKQFLTILLTTLPGWAGFVKYRTEWSTPSAYTKNPCSQDDYLAVRLVITCLLWKEAGVLLTLHRNALQKTDKKLLLESIIANEKAYSNNILSTLSKHKQQPHHTAKAQFVFCIDVRSEAFRRSLEAIDDYTTYGFAGFFGIPVHINNTITNDAYASCPVLLQPQFEVKCSPCSDKQHGKYRKLQALTRAYKALYQKLKYNFTTPFGLAECLGVFCGLSITKKTVWPHFSNLLNISKGKQPLNDGDLEPYIDNIPLEERCTYAKTFLDMIGLKSNFSNTIVLCGHGSTTYNNPYATSLDCGACGGRHGGINAKILAKIMNDRQTRAYLAQAAINIPDATIFIAAEHNTTTDAVTLYTDAETTAIKELKNNLEKARYSNAKQRLAKLQPQSQHKDPISSTVARSQDWAQVRPEWGLARNAAFIVGPRYLTADLNLEGRCFLHSYDYTQDSDGDVLTTILNGPMVVAQWINTQYLFSTLDNSAYGSGSKITANICGKLGSMQGNQSDLMTGLPLQSVYINDDTQYHQPMRLLTIIYAKKHVVQNVIATQPHLKKLFGNGWVQLAQIEPDTMNVYMLNKDLTWYQVNLH